MIKGVTLVRPTAGKEAQELLASFFSGLGFESGKRWERESSRGVSFLAPLGNLELVAGDLPVSEDILVEVTGLDAVHGIAEAWLVDRWGKDEASSRLSEIEDTTWRSRLFTAAPAAGFRIAFWEWSDPLRGRPLAVEGDLSAKGMRFAIVAARWNAVITERLLQGALDALLRSGADRRDIQILRVPGSWEIPQAARQVALTGRIDAVVTLGVLLRGETPHFEAIYTEVARGIGQSQQETGTPHAFGVLTCETLEQALDRAGLKSGNKGFEAALAAIEMASLQRKLQTLGGAAGAAAAASGEEGLQVRSMAQASVAKE